MGELIPRLVCWSQSVRVWHLQDDRVAPVELGLEGKSPCSPGSLGSVPPHHTTESEHFQYKLKDVFKNCLFEPQRLIEQRDCLSSAFFKRFSPPAERIQHCSLGLEAALETFGAKRKHGLAGLPGGYSTVLQRTMSSFSCTLEAKGGSVVPVKSIIAPVYILTRVAFARVAPHG